MTPTSTSADPGVGSSTLPESLGDQAASPVGPLADTDLRDGDSHDKNMLSASPSQAEEDRRDSSPSSTRETDKNLENEAIEETGPRAVVTWDPSYDEQPAPTLKETDSPDNAEDEPKERHLWKFHVRGYDDDEPTDWWFASTAVPLLAATIAPLANVLSIAALVTYWRMDLRDPDNPGQLKSEFEGKTFEDPRWAYWINVGSLICGFVGNIFLLFNFTGRIRYIIALPATIILWYFATGMVSAIQTIHIAQFL